jgi:hypothetical protein
MKTIKTKKALLSLALIAMAMFGIQNEAVAVADGNGLCSSSETANFDCAKFGTNVIEFRGVFPSAQCNGGSTSCSIYFYMNTYTTPPIQVDVAIPIKLNQTINTGQYIHCAPNPTNPTNPYHYYTNGKGDPVTRFGQYQNTLGICRPAFNLMGVPNDVAIPSNANFFISADPSSVDKTRPLDWQMKVGSSYSNHDHDDSRIYAGSILGPSAPQAEVLESGATLTTKTGASVSYTNKAGNITITGGSGRLVPISGTKLCIVKEGGDRSVPYTDPNFSANWDCETITYATEQCDIKTSGSDPCRFIGGNCIKY